MAAALGRTSDHFGLGGHPALGIAAPNTHRFCPGVHVAGFGCTGNVVRAVRVQPLIGSPGRRPLPLNRVRHACVIQIWWLQANPMFRPQASPVYLAEGSLHIEGASALDQDVGVHRTAVAQGGFGEFLSIVLIVDFGRDAELTIVVAL
jgi:hypothetical protein